MKEDIAPSSHQTNVVYTQEHWQLLSTLRYRASQVMDKLVRLPSEIFVYGSVARGDVHQKSDIDILITQQVASYRIERLLEQLDFIISERNIVMATPNHAIKGHIHLNQDVTITFPLIPFTPRELDFYDFSGNITVKELRDDQRVLGVTKALVLIIPTNEGHKERSILGMGSQLLNKYNISAEMVEERKRVLQRRQKVGRTGVFLNQPVRSEDGFELTLKQLADRNNIVRNKIAS